LARELAKDLGLRAPVGPARAGAPPRIHVAVGDPQAPLETVLGVLDSHRLLADDGRLRPDVALYSMGDHFDWGSAAEAERAGKDGLALLAWLASHPAESVHLVLGNHDLARVGELALFDDATFRAARLEAARVYADADEAAERDLLKRFPALPTAETAARDFASFTVAQRDLVASLLRARRFRIAFAFGPDVLLTHAGVTVADVGIDEADPDARAIAVSLNDRLDRALSAWTAGALAIDGLHQPGSAARGEGGGIFYHRPTSEPVVRARETLGRRFDPRTIPRGITQVIGHIGDEKCRALMPAWAEGGPANGVLRTLVIDGAAVRYGAGVFPVDRAASPERRRIVFTDGTMRHAPSEGYEILDLDRMTPRVP
jgi:hypothetical protein